MTTLGGSSSTSISSSSGIGGTVLGASTSSSSSTTTTTTTTTTTSSLDGKQQQQTQTQLSASQKKKLQKKKKKLAQSEGGVSAAAAMAAALSFLPLSQSDDEGILDYKVGGYHPVRKNDVFNGRYQIVSKLGWGHFSTVWLCLDKETQKQVALKIVRSAKSYTETAEDEIKLLKASGNSVAVARLLDHFVHKGPNGKHICMVFEVLGNNLLDLIKHYRYRGIPLPLVKSIMKQVIMGLDHLHTQCAIIHTDLKPENVLLRHKFDVSIEDFTWGHQYGYYRNKRINVPANQPPSPSSSSERYSSTSSDESTASSQSKNSLRKSTDSLPPPVHHRDEQKAAATAAASKAAAAAAVVDAEKKEEIKETTTTATVTSTDDVVVISEQEKEDEVGRIYSNGRFYYSLDSTRTVSGEQLTVDAYPQVQIVDLGNACWVNLHFTDDIQTRQYRSPEAIVRSKWSVQVDIWSAACMAFELATGDHLFKPKAGNTFNKSDDHLALMIELLGKFPKSVVSLGSKSKEFFTQKGELRNIPQLGEQWPLYNVLTEKYKFGHQEATEFVEFLTPMLHYMPERRATAKDCLNHPFLKDTPPIITPSTTTTPSTTATNSPAATAASKATTKG
ncbi:hypothetical protein SAMD00019534_011040 [Acytostelium subglobosum LB1]|uniref:hypothetical protein n=1 Tax=Acytostelium subglobosum LB1 TaxID=1410327 RepID=UPI0006449F1D|nr:hypothetical protein SAMD00019534_011040 [Acytostelium subglobosum LB1]GAM17929.1 hypothetical protein SAMD00019534_011040 [Acytostelium subglobosum LB1]|eukprot:XP_012758525.1 hypothetical protein SAMD00019534_011040 [Acytostelium subglobosum LB1]